MRRRQVVSADGTRLGVFVTGDGPPLVLVHGGTADHTRWDPVRDLLGRSFTLHLVDRRGRGASVGESDGPYALAREAEDVAAVADAIGGQAGVLGHSYGALCAMEAALASPAIGSLMLYEPPLPTPGLTVFPDGALDRIRAHMAAGSGDAALAVFLREVAGLSRPQVAAMRETPVWQARRRALPTVVREGEAAEGYTLSPGRLASLRVPTVVLAGTRTTPALAAASRAVHGSLPDARLVVLEGLGHCAMDEDPARFCSEVRAHFAADGGRRAVAAALGSPPV